MNAAYTRPPHSSSRREIILFISCLTIMSVLYGTPQLLNGAFSLAYFKELLVDCLFMAIACLPVWWLHFRKWAHWSLKKRFFMHLATSTLYYTIWVLLYQIYNSLNMKPLMDGHQILRNTGPNLLFYIQVFSVLHIYHFFHDRELQLVRERKLTELAHNAEISVLKAQIQPHFLFNTLNSISASLPYEQEDSRVLIARLADTFRYALLSTKEDVVPLSSELEFMKSYLSLEKVRFGQRLQFHIEADRIVSQLSIPPMLLQPLVENAVKHGIEPAVEGGMINIICKKVENRLFITIDNTGQPFEGNLEKLFNGKGVGLINMARRLEGHYGEKLKVEHCQGGGLSFSFHIPLTQKT